MSGFSGYTIALNTLFRLHHFSTTEPIFLKKQEAGAPCFLKAFNFIYITFGFLQHTLISKIYVWVFRLHNSFKHFVSALLFLNNRTYLFKETGSRSSLFQFRVQLYYTILYLRLNLPFITKNTIQFN